MIPAWGLSPVQKMVSQARVVSMHTLYQTPRKLLLETNAGDNQQYWMYAQLYVTLRCTRHLVHIIPDAYQYLTAVQLFNNSEGNVTKTISDRLSIPT